MSERFENLWISDKKTWSIVKDNKNNKFELRNNSKVIADYISNKNERPFYYYDQKIPNYVYKKICEIIYNEK